MFPHGHDLPHRLLRRQAGSFSGNTKLSDQRLMGPRCATSSDFGRPKEALKRSVNKQPVVVPPFEHGCEALLSER